MCLALATCEFHVNEKKHVVFRIRTDCLFFSLDRLYAVLTGITAWALEEIESADERMELIANGETPHIPDYVTDHPSLDILATVIKLCWIFDAEERATIFDVVQVLEEAVSSKGNHNVKWSKRAKKILARLE